MSSDGQGVFDGGAAPRALAPGEAVAGTHAAPVSISSDFGRHEQCLVGSSSGHEQQRGESEASQA